MHVAKFVYDLANIGLHTAGPTCRVHCTNYHSPGPRQTTPFVHVYRQPTSISWSAVDKKGLDIASDIDELVAAV